MLYLIFMEQKWSWQKKMTNPWGFEEDKEGATTKGNGVLLLIMFTEGL